MPSLTYSSISDVERATGVPKETLRVWERRYAFPQPKRDEGGHRRYPAGQVARLCLIKRLLDVGGRVGKIMHCTDDELNDLVHTIAPEALVGSVADQTLHKFLGLIKEHKVQELRLVLTQALLRKGLPRFVLDVAAPLTTLVEQTGAKEELAVFEAHLFGEIVQNVMSGAIALSGQHALESAPRILFANDVDGRKCLRLLMAEALFSLEGAYCESLARECRCSRSLTLLMRWEPIS